MRPTANIVFHLHRGAIYVRFKIETKGFPYNMNIFRFLDMTKHNDENHDDDDGDDNDDEDDINNNNNNNNKDQFSLLFIQNISLAHC